MALELLAARVLHICLFLDDMSGVAQSTGRAGATTPHHFAGHGFALTDAPTEAPAKQDTNLGLCHVRPTWPVVDLMRRQGWMESVIRIHAHCLQPVTAAVGTVWLAATVRSACTRGTPRHWLFVTGTSADPISAGVIANRTLCRGRYTSRMNWLAAAMSSSMPASADSFTNCPARRMIRVPSVGAPPANMPQCARRRLAQRISRGDLRTSG